MNFNITGTVAEINPVQEFETFKVQEFTIQTEGDFPTFVTLKLMNKNLDKYSNNLIEGMKITCHFNIKGYKAKNGSYYNNLDCWKIDI